MPKRNKEHHLIQCGIVEWYDMVVGDEMLIAIPNGEERPSKIVTDRNGNRRRICPSGARLKKEGARKGVWDLFLAAPMVCGCVGYGWKPYHGLWMEIKLPNEKNLKRGGLTAEQEIFGHNVRLRCYRTEVFYTTQQGIDTISGYLAGR